MYLSYLQWAADMQIMIKQLSDAPKYVNKSKRCQNILTQKITFRNATKSKFVYSLLIEVLQFCELKYNGISYCVSHIVIFMDVSLVARLK